MIALFTDFGLHGPYTGQMKAVLHQMAPGIPYRRPLSPMRQVIPRHRRTCWRPMPNGFRYQLSFSALSIRASARRSHPFSRGLNGFSNGVLRADATLSAPIDGNSVEPHRKRHRCLVPPNPCDASRPRGTKSMSAVSGRLHV